MRKSLLDTVFGQGLMVFAKTKGGRIYVKYHNPSAATLLMLVDNTTLQKDCSNQNVKDCSNQNVYS